jgi:hypothetical protein
MLIDFHLDIYSQLSTCFLKLYKSLNSHHSSSFPQPTDEDENMEEGFSHPEVERQHTAPYTAIHEEIFPSAGIFSGS